MKSKIFFLIMAGIMTQELAAAPKKLKGDDLSNMIIVGENRLRVNEKAPKTTWDVDMYKEVGAMIIDEPLFLGFKPPAVNEPAIAYASKQSTRKTATPWFDSILDTPVLSLHVKPPKGEKKVQWVFLVKDSQGNEVYRVKKQGVMPQQIDWAGFSSTNKPLLVGQDYIYSLSIIDEAGNPQHDAGKAFRVDAFRYKSGGKKVSVFTPTVLFQGEAELKFSKSGMNALVEIKDGLRTAYDQKIEIVNYDDDTKFGLARAQAIADYLMKELDWAPTKIATKSIAVRDGQGYRHVEIQTK